MTIEVVTCRVLVQPDDIKETDNRYKAAKNIPGFVIADTQVDREQAAVDKGTVVGFGPVVFKDFGTDNPLKVGDRIVYAKHAGKAVIDPETDETFVVINDEDVVAILRS